MSKNKDSKIIFSRGRLVIASIILTGVLMSAYFVSWFIREFGGNPLRMTIASFPIELFFIAVILQLSAHLLRAYKSKILIDPIRKTRGSKLFSYLSIGFLFNSILPFRIGELIRAQIAGRNLHMSRAVFFITILFERAVDVLIVVLLLFIILIVRHATKLELYNLAPLIATVLSVSLSIVFLIHYSFKENRRFLKLIYDVTGFFNDRVRNRARFIAWSVVYGIRTIYKKAKLWKYMSLAVVMWLLYLGSMIAIIKGFSLGVDLWDDVFISIISYVSVSIPSGPSYIGTYHYYLVDIIGGIIADKGAVLDYARLSWLVLIFPISLVGIGFLIWGWMKRGAHDHVSACFTDSSDFVNKLLRYEDISNEMSYFLDAYFSGVEIAKIVSDMEISDRIKLLKTYKGGSNATTLLVLKDGCKCVRKVTVSQHAKKLEAQRDWLINREHLENLPRVVGSESDDNFFTLDIEFKEGYIPFFEYIHSNDIENSKRLLRKIVAFSDESLHISKKTVYCREDLEFYIKTKIFDKMNDVAILNDSILSLLNKKQVVINGREYDNFLVIMEKITSDSNIMSRLSSYVRSDIHGDLTIDNIIVKGEDFILLDPNNENYIPDPLVDYAKLYQSLHSGYEFLCMLKTAEFVGNNISFEESISSKYTKLFQYLEETLKERLTRDRISLIRFHEAVHYMRMLTYRAKINPDSLPAFYSVAVRLLNEFYADVSGKDE